MTHVCVTCGTQFAPADSAPQRCPICEDERQYIGLHGQRWITLDDLRSTHRNTLYQEGDGIWGIETEPTFAIGQRALLIQTGAPSEQVIEAYLKAVELDPNSAGALVNLGTIYFNAHQWKEAERYYTQAIEVDPDYALAHFDFANLCDERGDHALALEHYLTALRLSPSYADVHYNIALLYQSVSQPMKAVRHWIAYLKLDPSSSWATIARRELAKLREAAVVHGSRG